MVCRDLCKDLWPEQLRARIGTVHRSCIALSALLSVALNLGASDTSWTLRFRSCALMGYELILSRLQGRKLEKPIVFRIPAPGMLDNTWLEVLTTGCVDADRCEPVAKGEIQRVRVSNRWGVTKFSGKFRVQFSSGSTIEGSFNVTEAKPHQAIICE